MRKVAERLHIFASIKPKPEHFNDAKTALEELIPPTLAEPGCHLFTVFENRDEPSILHLLKFSRMKPQCRRITKKNTPKMCLPNTKIGSSPQWIYNTYQ